MEAHGTRPGRDAEAQPPPPSEHDCGVDGCPCDVVEAPPGSAWPKRLYYELRRVVVNFTPSWFAVTMGTGITSILLRNEPYQFRGIDILSDIVFGLNVFLFVTFFLVGLARYLLWPRMFTLMLLHSSQSLFVGTFSIGFATIVNMIALACAGPWGHHFVTLGWVLWWIDASLSVIVCIGLLFLMFTRQSHYFHELTALWLLPVVCPIVSSGSGAVVSNTLTVTPARITIVISWALLGMGLTLAFILITIYFARLAVYKIPPAALLASTFIPLGPCGQATYTLLKLSAASYEMAKAQGEWLISTNLTSAPEARAMGTAAYAATLPMGLMLWGFGLVCLILALLYALDIALVGHFRFNFSWWGAVFSTGVYALATMELSHNLNSTTLRVIGTLLFFLELFIWFTMCYWSLRRVLLRQLYIAPCLQDTGEPITMSNARKYVH